MLYRLTKRSNHMMAAMLRKHVEFTPDKVLLSGKEVDEVLEVLPRDTDTCKVLAFHVHRECGICRMSHFLFHSAFFYF